MLKQLEASVNQDIKMKTAQVIGQPDYEDLEVNADDLGLWLAHFKDDPQIKKQADTIAKLHKDVFTNERIDELNFFDELPVKLDAKMYIAIYKKIWAAIRHQIYVKVI